MSLIQDETIAASSASVRRTASLALLLGTVFWGCGFTWAKMGGQAVFDQAIGLPDRSTFGPVFLLAWRFLIGGLAWLVIFPDARRNWTPRARRGPLVSESCFHWP